jgi:nanoRNase/pAp phosphatase (c-di-AMP/oligoRNAs hydrolase)
MRLDWASLLEILRGSDRVCLTSHIRPDCDALGSELGMAGVLEAIGICWVADAIGGWADDLGAVRGNPRVPGPQET